MIKYLIDPALHLFKLRDRIGEILLTERDSQKNLALADSADPLLWDFRVFSQQRDPIDCYTSAPPNGSPDASPIVNVAILSESLNEKGGFRELINPYNAQFRITAFGYGIAEATEDGHRSAELVAQDEAERAIGLARAILLAGNYRHLWVDGDPRKRHVRNRRVSQLQYEDTSIDESSNYYIQAISMLLIVDLDEVVRQVDGEAFESIAVNVRREDNGELFLLQFAADLTETP